MASRNFNKQSFDHSWARRQDEKNATPMRWGDSYRNLVKEVAKTKGFDRRNTAPLVACEDWSFESLSSKVQALIERSEDCWQWLGDLHAYSEDKEYPTIFENFRTMSVRVKVYMAYTAQAKGKTDKIYMECLNPACVNPEHMRLGR